MAQSRHDDLFLLLTSVRNKEEMERLLDDLLSPAEIRNIAQRWNIMQQVAAGRSHRAIAQSVRTSIAKVSRCARVVLHGNGAIVGALRKLRKPVKTSRSR